MFEINIGEYAEIIECCTVTTEGCDRCQPYMQIAVKVLDYILRHQYAFKGILYGIHPKLIVQQTRLKKVYFKLSFG